MFNPQLYIVDQYSMTFDAKMTKKMKIIYFREGYITSLQKTSFLIFLYFSSHYVSTSSYIF